MVPEFHVRGGENMYRFSLTLYIYLFVLAFCLLSPITKPVVAATIAGAEYFFDVDPGAGKGVSLPPKDGTFDGAEEPVDISGISTASLKIGPHTLFVRFLSSTGVWGLARPVPFESEFASPHNVIITGTRTLTGAEYFIDTDPGIGNGTPVTAADGKFDTVEENIAVTSIGIAGLSLGMHTLYLRLKDSEGTWGVLRQYQFEVYQPSLIASAEYFINTDPGPGSGTALTAKDGSFNSASEEIEKIITTTSLSAGVHTIGVRFMDARGRWGKTETAAFGIDAVPPDLTVFAGGARFFQQGQTMQIPITVTRTGGVLTSGSYADVRLYLSDNADWDSSDIHLWEANKGQTTLDFPNATLNSDGSMTVIATVAVPEVSNGGYYLIAYVDPPATSYLFGFHAESNEMNNTAVYRVTISNQPPKLMPLYRSYNKDAKSHYYTIDPADRANSTKPGYVFEKIEAYIYDKQFSDVVPLYRFYYAANTIYYFTTNPQTASAGYTEGPDIVGYVYPVQREYTVPAYHLVSNKDDHFYTISEFERNNAVKNYGFTEAGVAFYVSRTPNMGPVGGKPLSMAAGVDLITGNFHPYHNHVDFSVPSGRGIPFTFARTYNAFALGDAGALGEGWSHNYDIRIAETDGTALVKWGDGRIDEYSVSGGVYTPPAGVFSALAKTATGWTLTKTDRTVLGFDEYQPDGGLQSGTGKGRLSYLQDQNGNRSILEYAGDFLWKFSDATGRVYGFQGMTIPPGSNSESNQYRIASVYEVGLLGRSINFAYDNRGNLIEFRDAENNLTRYQYTADNLLKKVILPKGNEWSFNYEEQRLASHTFGPATTNFTRTVSGESSVTVNANPSAGFAGYTKNCADNPTAYTLTRCSEGGNPPTEIVSYNANLQPERVKDGKGNFWDYEYVNPKGNITKFTTPLAESTTFQYDALGIDLKLVTDPEGNETSYEYDNNGNLKKITRKDVVDGGTNYWSSTINYFTDEGHPWKGLVQSVTDPRNNTTSYEYDTYGYLKKIIAPTLKTASFVYDAGGRLMSQTDADGVTTTYSYDKLNRTKTVTDNLSRVTTYTYDANGNLDNVVDPRKIKTQYTYKADSDLLDTVTNVNTLTNATVMIAKNDYDPLGRLTSLTNAKAKSWRTNFDADGHVASQITPLGFADVFNQYDANGNLSILTDRINRITNTTWLTNNLPDTQTVMGGSSYSYSWFKNGQPKSATGPKGTTTFTYTTLGQIKSSTDPFHNPVGYSYDPAGNLASIIHPDGKVVTYGYSTRNLLETVKDWLNRTTTYSYSDAGRLTRVTYPNGAYIEYLYDASWRLKTVNNRKADGTLIVGYTVDAFDELDAPTQISKNDGIEPTVAAMNEAYSYDDNNRITSAGTATFTSNNLGEVLTRSKGGITTTFTWDTTDLPGMLKGISNGTTTRQYDYDSLGNRIAATVNGETTRYVLDLSGEMANVIAETDVSGNITAYYIHGLGLIARVNASDNTTRYYHYDRTGNAVALTDMASTVTDQYSYDVDPFAYNITRQGTTPNPFTFVGQYGVMDEGDNFYFMRARYYDAASGRFVSEDPIGFFAESINLFQYVGNNSMLAIDPKGLLLEYASEFNDIVKSLEDDPITKNLMAYLKREDTPLVKILNITQNKGNYAYRPSDKTVFISDKSKIYDAAHELGHAEQHLKKLAIDKNYVMKETKEAERYTMEKYENPLRLKNGKTIRICHPEVGFIYSTSDNDIIGDEMVCGFVNRKSVVTKFADFVGSIGKKK